MCGLVGIVAKTDVTQDIYDALTVLQHRGQDAAGIVNVLGNIRLGDYPYKTTHFRFNLAA